MPRQKKDGKVINYYVRKDLVDRLDVYSEKSMIPKTSIIEVALKEYLDKVDPEEIKTKA